MNEPSEQSSGSELRLVLVLDGYLAALQAGAAPSQDELLEQHPDLATDLHIEGMPFYPWHILPKGRCSRPAAREEKCDS